jgi:hypothetical protein
MTTVIVTPAPPAQPFASDLLTIARTVDVLQGVRCAEPTCRARLTLEDANPTLGCESDGDVYCGDHILDHIAVCTVCAFEAHSSRDES